MSKKSRIYFLYIVLFAVAYALDRFTKVFAVARLKGREAIPLIKDVLELRYLENTGAAFGILQGKQTLFYIITVLVCLFIVYLLVKTPQTRHYSFFIVLLILILAGALGNFTDRVSQHYVVDFIYFKLINFPIFNVADMYVTCGAILLGLKIIFGMKDEDFEFLSFKKSTTEETVSDAEENSEV